MISDFYNRFIVFALLLLVPMVTCGQSAEYLDPSFNYGSSQYSALKYNGNQNIAIYASKLQPDGKTIIAGNFFNYDNKGINYVARLNSNGTVDTSFKIGNGPMWNTLGGEVSVRSIAIQSDGKILIGGHFRGFNHKSYSGLVRLHSNGRLDTTFNIGSGFKMNNQPHSINAISIQNDGKIIAGGNFNRYNGTAYNNFIRLNQDGTTDTSFQQGTGCNSIVNAITIRSNNQIFVAGGFGFYNGMPAMGIVKLFENGVVDTTFNQTGVIFQPIIRCLLEQSDGKVLIGGLFEGSPQTYLVRLNESGSKDLTFSTGFMGNDYSFVNNGVFDMVQLPSRKIIIVGGFSTILVSEYISIARLNRNGSVDNSFNNGNQDYQNIRTAKVYSVILKSGGKLFTAGTFSGFNNYVSNSVIQLDTNAVIDTSFNELFYAGPKGRINKVAIQADGKILIGGSFTQQNGANPKNICRLLSNGALDNSFLIGTGANGPVNEVVVQPDGLILVAGEFTNFNGTSCFKIVRLNSDGLIDNSFSIRTIFDTMLVSIKKIIVQPDRKILVGGSFNTINRFTNKGIVRFNFDGTIDSSFNTGRGLEGTNAIINDFCLLASGKILVGGSFSSINGTARQNLASLNADGTLDTSFNAGSIGGGIVNSITNVADNKVVIGGNFNSYNGITCPPLIRLTSNGSNDSTFRINVFFLQRLTVFNAAYQPTNGKILVSCFFTGYRYGGFEYSDSYQLIEVDTNGYFGANVNYLSNYVSSIEIQNDNKILVGGDFIFTNPRFRTPIFRYGQRPCPEVQGVLTISGSTTLCEGETGVLTSSATTGNLWSTGDTTQRIRVPAGTFTMVSQIVNGCTTAISSFGASGGIDINFAPEIPFIVYTNLDSLEASTEASSYQWTYNGVVQPFTTRKIPIQGNGSYSVRAISDLDCKSRNSQVFTVLSARNLKQMVKLDLYPNPTNGIVTLTTSIDSESVTITNSLGQVVYKTHAQQQMELNLSHLASGVYMVQVQSSKGISTERLVLR